MSQAKLLRIVLLLIGKRRFEIGRRSIEKSTIARRRIYTRLKQRMIVLFSMNWKVPTV
jgi:hypothetical protein